MTSRSSATNGSSSFSDSRSVLQLTSPGEERFVPYTAELLRSDEHDPPMIWHGSSMALIARAHPLLQDEFNVDDPEKDFTKWKMLGAQPYFLAVVEASSQVLSCCLRCVLDGEDGWGDRNTPADGSAKHDDNKALEEYCTRRLVVDYLVTLDEYQGRGYASHLLHLVTRVAAAHGANCYVIAQENACVYWMSKGFVLEPNGAIHSRLNHYNDSFLLKLPTNKPEDPAFLATIPRRDMEEDNDDNSNKNEQNNDDNDMSDDGDGGDGNDGDLQRAIMASLDASSMEEDNDETADKIADDQGDNNGDKSMSGGEQDDDDVEVVEADDDDIQRAILMSLAGSEMEER